MATVNQLAEQLAELTARVAYLERFSPEWQAKQKEAERVARVARIAAVVTLADVDALAPADRSELLAGISADRLITMLAKVKRKDRERILERVDHRRKACVVFALAAAPALVEVTAVAGFEMNPLPLTDEQAAALRAAGVRIRQQDRTLPAELPGFCHPRGDVFVVDEPAWYARCEVDYRIGKWIAAGKISVRRLSDDEARNHACRAYLDKWDGRASSSGGPQLPAI